MHRLGEEERENAPARMSGCTGEERVCECGERKWGGGVPRKGAGRGWEGGTQSAQERRGKGMVGAGRERECSGGVDPSHEACSVG